MTRTIAPKQVDETFLAEVVTKISIQEYKKLADNNECYAPKTLKSVMGKIGRPTEQELNFYLYGGYIYIFPESGIGPEYDIILLEEALKQ